MPLSLRLTTAGGAAAMTIIGCTLYGRARGAPDAPPAAPKVQDTVTLTPAQTSLHRTRFLLQSPPPGVTSTIREPGGSRLMIDLLLDLPLKSSVIDVVEVRGLSATDDQGKDLVGPMLAHGASRPLEALKEMLVPRPPFGAAAIRWHLGAPDASAKSVTANLEATVLVRDGFERIELIPPAPGGPEWTKIESPSLGDAVLEYRFGGMLTNEFVVIRPTAAAQRFVFRVNPRDTPQGERATPSTQDRETVSYLINRRTNSGEKPTVTLNRGVREVTIELKSQAIPLP